MSEKKGGFQPPSKISLWLLHNSLLVFKPKGWGGVGIKGGGLSLHIAVQRGSHRGSPNGPLMARIKDSKERKGMERSEPSACLLRNIPGDLSRTQTQACPHSETRHALSWEAKIHKGLLPWLDLCLCSGRGWLGWAGQGGGPCLALHLPPSKATRTVVWPQLPLLCCQLSFFRATFSTQMGPVHEHLSFLPYVRYNESTRSDTPASLYLQPQIIQVF